MGINEFEALLNTATEPLKKAL